MNTARRDFIMTNNDLRSFEIPTGMKYVAVLNNTDNTVELYQKQVVASDISDILVKALPYQNITVPIRTGNGEQFTVIWTDGGVVGEKNVSIIFADENLNINSLTGSAAGSSNVSLVSESIGLARQAQLPAALSNGNLKTEVMNTPAVTAAQLPATLSPSGGLRVSSNDFKGSHSNAWNNVAVGAGGTSNASDDLWYSDVVSVYGTASAATNITVQFSANGSTYYDSEIVKAVNGNFGFTFDCAARYVKLKSSAAATITASITAK